METGWDIDSHEYAMGRKFNEMRRSLLWAEAEIERLCDNSVIDTNLISVCRTEYALLRDKLEELHVTIFEFPRIMELTEEVTAIENPTPEQLYAVRMMQIGYDSTILKARAIEKQIDQMTNLLPISLHAYLYQSNDPEIKLKLRVLQRLMEELQLIFRIEAEVILVGGPKYAVMTLRNEQAKIAIVMVPISVLNHMLGWFPLAHEIGHVLVDQDPLAETIYDRFHLAFLSKVGMEIDKDPREYVLKVSWNWFTELLADLVMVEAFKVAAIGFSGIHRELHSNYEFSSTHPPDILRVRFMIDYVQKRMGLDEFVTDYQKGFNFKKLETPGALAGEWGFLAIWQDRDFQNRLQEIMIETIGGIVESSNFDESVDAYSDIIAGRELDLHSIYNIVSALPIAYLESGEVEILERTYLTLKNRLSNSH